MLSITKVITIVKSSWSILYIISNINVYFILQSPLLLLFLDCVWQLIQQFPTQFEFTETYLTTLWDASHISIFDTFLFDCEKDRYLATTTNVCIISNYLKFLI